MSIWLKSAWRLQARHLSQSSPSIFSSHVKRVQKDRALDRSDSQLYDYLKEEISFRMADRIFDIKRRFPVMVDLGTHKGMIGTHLSKDTTDCIIHCSSSYKSLDLVKPLDDIEVQKMLVEEEDFRLEENSVDLVISSLHLHWVNDLPRLFSNVFYSLKPDGVFIGSMFGGQTLFELRCCLQMAETEREGGFGLHVSPFITAQDIGGLLNRAGFTMLTIDADELVVNYPTMFELMYDLKGMGENNALLKGRTHINRDTLLAAASIYQNLYAKTVEDGKMGDVDDSSAVPATFQVFYFIGWKPHPSQPKPSKRGSANFSLKDIADLEKIIKK